MEKTDHFCNKCNKYFSSNNSLWEHNKKFHKNNNKLKCDYCNKEFSFRQGKHVHMKKCKIKYDENIKETALKEEINKMKKEMEELKQQLIINGNNNTINNNSNNTTHNIIQLVAYGKENIDDVFTKKEQKDILKHKCNAIEKITKEIHCNDKFPQCRNIFITNLKDNIAYTYDDEYKDFIAVDKNKTLEDLIRKKAGNMETFLKNNEFDLKENFRNKIEEIIDRASMDDDFISAVRKEIELLLYNNRNKIKTGKK